MKKEDKKMIGRIMGGMLLLQLLGYFLLTFTINSSLIFLPAPIVTYVAAMIMGTIWSIKWLPTVKMRLITIFANPVTYITPILVGYICYVFFCTPWSSGLWL